MKIMKKLMLTISLISLNCNAMDSSSATIINPTYEALKTFFANYFNNVPTQSTPPIPTIPNYSFIDGVKTGLSNAYTAAQNAAAQVLINGKEAIKGNELTIAAATTAAVGGLYYTGAFSKAANWVNPIGTKMKYFSTAIPGDYYIQLKIENTLDPKYSNPIIISAEFNNFRLDNTSLTIAAYPETATNQSLRTGTDILKNKILSKETRQSFSMTSLEQFLNKIFITFYKGILTTEKNIACKLSIALKLSSGGYRWLKSVSIKTPIKQNNKDTDIKNLVRNLYVSRLKDMTSNDTISSMSDINDIYKTLLKNNYDIEHPLYHVELYNPSTKTTIMNFRNLNLEELNKDIQNYITQNNPSPILYKVSLEFIPTKPEVNGIPQDTSVYNFNPIESFSVEKITTMANLNEIPSDN